MEEAQGAAPCANSPAEANRGTSGTKSRRLTRAKKVRALKAAAGPEIVDNEMRRKLRPRVTSGKAAQV